MTTDAEFTFHILCRSAQRLAEDHLKGLADLGFSIEEIQSVETLALKDLIHLGRLGEHFLDVKIDHQRFARALAHWSQSPENDRYCGNP